MVLAGTLRVFMQELEQAALVGVVGQVEACPVLVVCVLFRYKTVLLAAKTANISVSS